jgi:hypothetical protein
MFGRCLRGSVYICNDININNPITVDIGMLLYVGITVF